MVGSALSNMCFLIKEKRLPLHSRKHELPPKLFFHLLSNARHSMDCMVFQAHTVIFVREAQIIFHQLYCLFRGEKGCTLSVASVSYYLVTSHPKTLLTIFSPMSLWVHYLVLLIWVGLLWLTRCRSDSLLAARSWILLHILGLHWNNWTSQLCSTWSGLGLTEMATFQESKCYCLRLLGLIQTSAAFLWPRQVIGSALFKSCRNRLHLLMGRYGGHIAKGADTKNSRNLEPFLQSIYYINFTYANDLILGN